MDNMRLDKQISFCREIDKEKFINRQTLLTDGKTNENDSEHAWHMAIMCLVLSEYSNNNIDLLKTVSMILIHDIVEIDAGDTYAYDDAATATQRIREKVAADRIFGLLPDDQKEKFISLWNEFEEGKSAESKFAHVLDNFQPCMLNNETKGKKWKEHNVRLSQILKRNEITGEGSEVLWQYQINKYVKPNVLSGKIIDDINRE